MVNAWDVCACSDGKPDGAMRQPLRILQRTQPTTPVLATDVIRVSVPPDAVGHHARMLDLFQRLHESNGLNAGEEVDCRVICPEACAPLA